MTTKATTLDDTTLDTVTGGSPKIAEHVCKGKVYPKSRFNGQSDADGVITPDWR